MATEMATPTKKRRRAKKDDRWQSRAVVRPVEAGSSVDCVLCDERVKFQAKKRHQQVICNVYVRGVWDRVEHYHHRCYTKAGRPHGAAAA